MPFRQNSGYGVTNKEDEKKHGTAIRMTCEIQSVSDLDVVDVSSSRLTPPGIVQHNAVSYV